MVHVDAGCRFIDRNLANGFGWVGFSASLLLFFSPLPVMRIVWERGYIESYSVMPYLLAFANALVWSVYALPAITPCETNVLSCNVIGCFLELIYVAVFIRNAGPRRKQLALQASVVAGFLTLMIIFGTAVAANISFTPWPNRSPPITRQSSVMGFFAFFTTVAMFASPLSVVAEVRRTHSVEYMPIALTAATMVCATVWTAYGAASYDFFIIVPNALGVAFGLLQLALYSWYSQPSWYAGWPPYKLPLEPSRCEHAHGEPLKLEPHGMVKTVEVKGK